MGRLLPVGPPLCKRSIFACSRRADGGAARGGGGGRRVCGNISGLALDRAGQEVSLAGCIKTSPLRILGNGQCGRWLQAVISAAERRGGRASCNYDPIGPAAARRRLQHWVCAAAGRSGRSNPAFCRTQSCLCLPQWCAAASAVVMVGLGRRRRLVGGMCSTVGGAEVGPSRPDGASRCEWAAIVSSYSV